MRRLNFIVIFILIIFSFSCVDEYYPDVEKYENLLVVDGLVTNGSESVVIRLYNSSPVNNPEIIPHTNAEIYLTNENQFLIPLYEADDGIYKTEDESFRAEIGESYQLHITTDKGKKYISDICKMNSPSPIDSIYGVKENTGTTENSLNFPGVQFYIENHSESADTSYYIWRLVQTYKYRSSFDIDFTWEGEFIPNPDATALRTCWISNVTNDLLVASTEDLEPNTISKFPLNFVSTNTKEMSIRYSLLVKQLSITEKAYRFYEAIAEQNKDQGNMWSKQPIQILGNIRNINDENDPVLGYFIVAGTTEKRIFINRPNIPFYYDECPPDFEGMRFIQFEPQELWPIYIDDIMFLGWARAHSRYCFDCTLSGGETTPPDFWVEQ